jgi:hypothetical protein
VISSAPDGLAEAMRRLGYHVLWKVPGHFGHIHIETPDPAATPAAPVSGP